MKCGQNIHTHTLIGHGLPRPYTLAPPPFITCQPLVEHSCGRHHCRQKLLILCFLSLQTVKTECDIQTSTQAFATFFAAGRCYFKYVLVVCLFVWVVLGFGFDDCDDRF